MIHIASLTCSNSYIDFFGQALVEVLLSSEIFKVVFYKYIDFVDIFLLALATKL